MSLMILSHLQNRCLHITLDHGLNKLSHQFTQMLTKTLQEAEENPNVHVVILCGSDKAFSVGADLDELAALLPDEIDHWLAPWEAVAGFSKPIIMALDGYVLGGGLEIALMGDLLIATERTIMGQPEIKLALLPGCGGTLRLTQLMGYHRAFEFCATGEFITARRAYEFGLVNTVVKEEDLLTRAFEMASRLEKLSLTALKKIKNVLKQHYDSGQSHRLSLQEERTAFKELLLLPDAHESIRAFMEKRTPRF